MTPDRSVPEPSLWRIPQVRAMFAGNIAGFASYFLTLGALPAWALENGGHPQAVVGTISTMLLAATLVTQASAPYLMRTVSTRLLVVLGLLLLAVPSPFYVLATDLVALYGLSVVRGVGFGLLTVVGAVVIPQASPVHRRGEAIGIYGLAAAVPSMLAVSAGAALTLSGGFTWVAWLAAVPVLGLLPARWLPAGTMPGEPGQLRRLPAVLRRLVLPSTLLFLVTMAGGGLMTLLPLERPDGNVAAAVLLLFGATGTAARWQVGRITDRVGHQIVQPLLTALAVLSVTTVALGLAAGSDVVLAVGAGLFGVSFGALQTTTLDVSMQRVPDDASTVSAVWNAAFDGGTAAGAAVIGFIAGTALGPGWAMGLAAGGIAVALVGGTLGSRPSRVASGSAAR